MGSNCVASASIGCLFCCKGCNAEKLRNAFTFMPPTPASYSLESAQDPQDPQKRRIVYAWENLIASNLYQQAAEAADVLTVRTRMGSEIPIVWFRSKSSPLSASSLGSENSIVLLHCHGNATDIGIMMGAYYELFMILPNMGAKDLNIDVVGVEYSGYGVATGKPSTVNCNADMEAVYDYLVENGVQPNRIVAYGQSVGSGPVSSLAVNRDLGGVILHSPLLSGIKVIDPQPDRCCRPSCAFYCFDFFPNDRSVKKFRSKVFIMHGKRDEVVPFYHGSRLYHACPEECRYPPYFPERAGHNNVVEKDMRAYFFAVYEFLKDVQTRAISAAARASAVVREPKGIPANSVAAVPLLEAELAAREVRLVADWPSSGLGAISSVTEVPSGPQDGRYQAARGGDFGPALVTSAQTRARELGVVCQQKLLGGVPNVM